MAHNTSEGSTPPVQREEQSFEELRAPNVPSRSSDVSDVLPTVGLIYEPSHVLSFYTSYSTSFVPVNANAVDLGPISVRRATRSAGRSRVIRLTPYSTALPTD